jgi:hypothetical protein
MIWSFKASGGSHHTYLRSVMPRIVNIIIHSRSSYTMPQHNQRSPPLWHDESTKGVQQDQMPHHYDGKAMF